MTKMLEAWALSPSLSVICRSAGDFSQHTRRNATMCLHTGDWVRVNGVQGTVEVLGAQEQIVMRVRDQN